MVPFVPHRGLKLLSRNVKRRAIEAIESSELGVYEPYVEPVYHAWVNGLDGRPLGIVPLNSTMFGQDLRPDLVHRAVCWQMECARADAVALKSRHDVRGSTRKLHRQKGSGRARVGTRRSPIRVGGGHAHPRRARSYAYDLPKAIQRKALMCVLSTKLAEGNLLLVNSLQLPTPKTRFLDRLLKNQQMNKSVCFIDGLEEELDPNFFTAANNLHYARILSATQANCVDMLSQHTVVLTLPGLRHLERRLLGSPLPPVFEFETLPPLERAQHLLAEFEQEEASLHVIDLVV